ncbi:MAG TPA: 3-phosphoshikimate 1-carboxyvinyltransferase [Pirellulaceae bacterium]
MTLPSQVMHPVRGPIRGTIRPPGSKSITNRTLVCAALADGPSELRGVLDSDDTRVMVAALEQLGVSLRWDHAADSIAVVGCRGILRSGPLDLHAENSGTTLRFLAAVLALGQGRYRLDGNARMRQRPISDLIEALAALGVNARAELDNGCPPVVLDASGLPGGTAMVAGDVSSQFLSGLLMAAPYAAAAVELELSTELISLPYVRMTQSVMADFGVAVVAREDRSFGIAPAHYRGRDYDIEPDASAATYFWGAAAITRGEVVVQGLSRSSLQGDVAFVDCLAEMGCEVTETTQGLCVRGSRLRGLEADLRHLSDTVPTLAAVALFADGPTTLRGIGHIRHKESDRIGDLARELRRLGATVDEAPDGLRITPGPLHSASLASYDDHRLAMGLSLVGLRVPGIEIENPGCVAKTYPRYFADLAQLTAGV